MSLDRSFNASPSSRQLSRSGRLGARRKGHGLLGVMLLLAALIGPAFTANSAATAQTATTTTTPVVRALTVKLQVIGPRPATITGYSVTTTCRANADDTVGVAATQGFSSFGGAAAQYFALNSNSACIVGVVPTGTGGRNAGVYLAIAGTVRASGTLGTGFSMTPAQFVPLTGDTAIDVVVSYPSFTVRAATVGTESVPGGEYKMALVCTYNDGLIYAALTFPLRSGASKMFSTLEIPELVVGSSCRVTEIEGNGASVITIDTQPVEPGTALLRAVALPDGSAAGTNPFVDAAFVPPIRPRFASAGFNPNGSVVTVTNRYVGDLMVSKVVTGQPRSNIAIYELQLSCNEGGVKDSFLLKHGQTWLRTGLQVGWSCAVAELRSDGAVVSYSDNSGENATDGRIVIKGTPSGCVNANFTLFPDCRANVIVTNDYPDTSATSVVPTGIAETPAPAPTTAVTSVTVAPVAAAPVEAPEVLDASEETIG